MRMTSFLIAFVVVGATILLHGATRKVDPLHRPAKLASGRRPTPSLTSTI